jgi:hypothetical protein
LASWLCLGLPGCGGGGGGSTNSPVAADFYVFSNDEPNIASGVGVSVLTRVVLTFSAGVEASSVRPDTVTLLRNDAAPVEATLAVTGQQVTLTPTKPLDVGVRYEIQVSSQVRSQDGAILKRPYQRSFVTEEIALRHSRPFPHDEIGHGGVLAIGDFDGDGQQDVALTRTRPARLTVYLQDRNGQLRTPLQIPLSRPDCDPSSLQAADLNNDGRMDLVVGAFISSSDRNGNCGVDVLLQTPEGSMSLKAAWRSERVWKLAVADMTGDGLMDIVGVGSAEEEDRVVRTALAIWTQRRDGTFALAAEYPVVTWGSAEIHLADLNKDGRMDVVAWADAAEPTQMVFYQRPGGLLGPPIHLAPALLPGIGDAAWSGATVFDADDDGKVDIVITTGGNAPSASVVIYAQGADGTFKTQSGYAAYEIPTLPVAADMNNDGLLDLVIVHYGWSAVSVHQQRPAQGLFRYTRYALDIANIPSGGIAVGDLNGDGLRDIALADPSGLTLLYQIPRP